MADEARRTAGQPLMDLPAWARSGFLALPDSFQAKVRHRTGRFAPWENGVPPVAPPPPAGMTVGPPDFVGVGVPKAGTSWWFSLILAHPDVHGPVRKELLYFNRHFFEQFRDHDPAESDLTSYHDWFPRPSGALTGEWTPSYLFSYRLPPILRRAAPKAKVLILLRDPVERYQSDISRSMPSRRLRNVRYRGLARGFYAAELAPWEAEYDASEMLILQYEACTLHPAEQLAATYRFLGLDDAYQPPQLQAAVNKTSVKRTLEPGFVRLLTELYEPDVVAVNARHPEIDLALWPHFATLGGR
jgi:hypothetical protein